MVKNEFKYKDEWFETFGPGEENEKAMLQSVEHAEANSIWDENINRRDCSMKAVRYFDTFDPELLKHLSIPDYVVADTVAQNEREEATKTGMFLSIKGLKYYAVASTPNAIGSIRALVGNQGSDYGRLSLEKRAAHLTDDFEVAPGKMMILTRYGKLRAVHSDGENGYARMPIPELIKIVQKAIRDKFGYCSMRNSFHSNDVTRATWDLVNAQMDLTTKYQDTINAHSGSKLSPTFMPGVCFASSDTSNSAARLEPVFITDSGCILHFVDGVKVDHKKTSSTRDPMKKFEEEANNIFAKFDDIFEKLAALSDVKIYHAENAIIYLCGDCGIPAKYGESAREMAAMLAYGEPYITAHDLYLCMMKVMEAAKEAGASGLKILNLDEQLASIPKIKDWSVYDVGGGTPAWGAKPLKV